MEKTDNFDNNIAQYTSCSNKNTRQKIYRAQGVIMFCVSVGVLLMRLILGFLPIKSEVVADIVFTIPLQVGILVLMPFFIYKFSLNLSFKQILSFSNIKKTKWYNIALVIPLAICFYCFTIGVSGVWQTIIMLFGYTHSSVPPLPTVFNPYLFVLSLILTALLPGFCEEFCNRGGFLTTMRSSFSFVTTIVILGLAFGMFHQNITQIFYTMFFGAFAAFLTLKSNSVLPAMVMHFLNNAFSVINEYCYSYGWLGGGFNAALDWAAMNNPLLIAAVFLGMCAIGIALILLFKKLNTPKTHANTTPTLPIKEVLYKPTLKDNAFYIGAIVMAVLTTIFTFIFGYIV